MFSVFRKERQHQTAARKAAGEPCYSSAWRNAAAVLREGTIWRATAVLPAAAEPAAVGSNPAGRSLAVIHVVAGGGLAAGAYTEI